MIKRFQKSRRQRARRRSAYLADRSGAALVEYALVAGPFLLLLMGVIEIGLLLIGSVDLKNSTGEVARMIRVGQTRCLTKAEIESLICQNATMLPDCAERLEVQQTSSALGFGSGMSELLDGDTFDAVKGGEVVIVETTYNWALFTPMVASVIGDSGGDVELQQSFVFQNETYGANACP